MSALQPQRRRLLQATPLWPTSRRNCRTSSEPRPAKLWTRECRKIWFPRQHEDLIAELISLTLERRLYILGISSSHRNKLAELSYMWSLGGIDCRIKHIYPYSIYVHNSSLKVSNLVLTSNLLMNPDAKSILQSSLTIIILSSFGLLLFFHFWFYEVYLTDKSLPLRKWNLLSTPVSRSDDWADTVLLIQRKMSDSPLDPAQTFFSPAGISPLESYESNINHQCYSARKFSFCIRVQSTTVSISKTVV